MTDRTNETQSLPSVQPRSLLPLPSVLLAFCRLVHPHVIERNPGSPQSWFLWSPPQYTHTASIMESVGKDPGSLWEVIIQWCRS